MSAVLLRLCLIVLLVLDGTGQAMAWARAEAGERAAQAGAPCHDAGDAMPAHDPPPAGHDHLHDGAMPADCDCPCAQHAPALAPASGFALAPLAASAPPRAPPAAHVPPPPSRLIRPPIA
ncbi:MAG TPA: CopL family metal-binding regulatory protein [Lysobacter sp.]|nr:CopL family metal-binding regulatory protein [Lysobacter sp.]